MIKQGIFENIFVIPIVNALMVFYVLFVALHMPGALGWAIIALTLAIRVLLHPMFVKQVVTQKKMQELKPQLDVLAAKYKQSPQKLQQEQMRIYKEAGLNPASGCVPMLVQLPLFIGLYNTLNTFLGQGTPTAVVKSINNVLYAPWLHVSSISTMFFGIDLATTPAKAGNAIYLLIPLITGALQYVQTVETLKTSQPAKVDDVKLVEKKTKKAIEKKEEKSSSMGGDFQKAMNTQMKYVMPLMIGYFAYTLPVGLSLYWNLFAVISIIQYRHFHPDKKSAETGVII